MSIQGVKSIILIVLAFWIFIGWDAVYGDYAACFNSEKDYKQFLTSNNTGYIASFPCPTNDGLLNQNLSKDESGKWYSSRRNKVEWIKWKIRSTGPNTKLCNNDNHDFYLEIIEVKKTVEDSYIGPYLKKWKKRMRDFKEKGIVYQSLQGNK